MRLWRKWPSIKYLKYCQERGTFGGHIVPQSAIFEHVINLPTVKTFKGGICGKRMSSRRNLKTTDSIYTNMTHFCPHYVYFSSSCLNNITLVSNVAWGLPLSLLKKFEQNREQYECNKNPQKNKVLPLPRMKYFLHFRI